VLEAASLAGIRTRISLIGLPDAFLPHAPRARLLAEAGLDPESIARRIATARQS
jgi:deoxyxylulose-5-phosphate synthase